MPIPINVEELFKLNPLDNIEYHENWVCIDDFYKNFDQIQTLFEHMPVESWKMSKWSRNFKDYYDCRPAFANWEPSKEMLDQRLEPLNNLVGGLVGWDNVAIEKSLAFNVFQHKKENLPITKQHHPHYDRDMVNILIYIDKHANGGTALYENEDILNKEGSNLIIDVSDFKIKEIIPAKPNRCVIFSGNFLHGAYIEDNDVYYNNWRITQASIVWDALELMAKQGDA
ncbi:MAG: hypothetical protein L7S72_01905 [Flavobacteriales bacterium]|nr:hypothetical protein [Flavobacteriales bacterium]